MSTPLRLVGVDFETYWDTAYSLRRMSTPLYVRDPRFLAFGAAVKIDRKPAQWVSGQNLRKLFGIIDWSQVILYGHNLIFDGFILSDGYDVVPARYVDTLALSRAVIGNKLRRRGLHEVGEFLGLGGKLDGGKALNDMRGVNQPDAEQLNRLAHYAVRDIELTYNIMKKLVPQFPTGELPVQDWVVRMMTQPRLEFDPTLLEMAYLEEVERKKELLAGLSLDRTAINSNDQFAELLRAEGVEPPMKISKTTGKETYAFAKTDQQFVELEDSGNPRIAALVQCRLGVKSSIEETRAKSFLDLANTGKSFPVPLNYSGAHTHRLSGGAKLNFQNLGRKSKIRKAIVAPRGHVCVVADSSQIELRISAAIVGQTDLLDALKAKRDPYGEFGTDLFGKEVSSTVNKDLRLVSKIAVLQLGYQSGPPRFKAAVWTETNKLGTPMSLTDKMAKDIVYGYRRRFSKYKEGWEHLTMQLMRMSNYLAPTNLPTDPPLDWYNDSIVGPSGLALNYPQLRQQADLDEGRTVFAYTDGAGTQFIYGGKLLENLSQFLAREVVTWQTTQILKRYFVSMQVHDELVLVVPGAEADECSKFVRTVMSTSPPFWPDLPVSCDVKCHEIYGEAK